MKAKTLVLLSLGIGALGGAAWLLLRKKASPFEASGLSAGEYVQALVEEGKDPYAALISDEKFAEASVQPGSNIKSYLPPVPGSEILALPSRMTFDYLWELGKQQEAERNG